MCRWVTEWLSRQVENFYSFISLISSITHSWCTWHFHDKSFWHRTSAPGAKVLKCPICPERKWKSEKTEREGESMHVCMCLSAYESSLQQVAVQWRITHSNRFLWVDCQGNGFLNHICSEENTEGENKMKKSANRLRARIPLIRSRVCQTPAH